MGAAGAQVGAGSCSQMRLTSSLQSVRVMTSHARNRGSSVCVVQTADDDHVSPALGRIAVKTFIVPRSVLMSQGSLFIQRCQQVKVVS